MNPLRLVIVTRRFWPMSGSVELAVGDLACALESLGHHVQIVTARWGKNWPGYFLIREVPVYRIARPTAGPWGSFRFQRAVSRFLEQSFEENRPIDGVIVFGLGQETDSVIRTLNQLNSAATILVRIDNKIDAYHRWSQNANRRSLFGLSRATGVIADSDTTRDHLVRFSVNENKIHVIPDGVSAVESNRSGAEQGRARQSLSDAHPILVIEPDQPLVVTMAAMDNDGGLLDLISAWPRVLKSYPRAKLWTLGDGTHDQQIWNAITAKELVHSVIMPGYFDDLETVFQAADLYVHPLRSDTGCSGLTRAMAHQVCPVATATLFTEPLVEKNKTGLVTPKSNPQALAEAIIHGLENRDMRNRLGNAASKRVLERFSISEQARTYIKLISKQADPIAQPAQ